MTVTFNRAPDRVLLVFATVAERDAYTDTYDGLPSTIVQGDVWAIRDGATWRASTRANVLANVNLIAFGTLPFSTDAEQAVLQQHLQTDGRHLLYLPLQDFVSAA